LKEIVELLFARGFIKLLFATETFSCGLNMPIKTVIFTDVSKFDGHQFRVLLGHEYIQAGGRAGRRGLDTVGHVIHLNNLFRPIELTDYKNMMQGKSQKLVSKFKISYHMILNLIKSGDTNYISFIKRSLIQQELDAESGAMYYELATLEQQVQQKYDNSTRLRTPAPILERYLVAKNLRQTAVNKRRKELDREIEQLEYDNRSLLQDIKSYETCRLFLGEVERKREELNNTEKFLESCVQSVVNLLTTDGFIQDNMLTSLGMNACELREVHCLTFARLYGSGSLKTLTSIELIELFSCFTNVTVDDDHTTLSVPSNYQYSGVKSALNEIDSNFKMYSDYEVANRVDTGASYKLHYDLLNYISEWIECIDEKKCKLFLARLEQEKGIFLGEFVKAVLKINNISAEMEKLAELNEDIEFLSKLREISGMTMKYVATNQSLYV
jgi:superfamily II RNA helicase